MQAPKRLSWVRIASVLPTITTLVSCAGTGNDDSVNTPPDGLQIAAPISIDDGHAVGAVRWSNSDTSSGGLGQNSGGLNCDSMVESYHIHSHLSIFLDGQQIAVPPLIGIVTSPNSTCFYSLHTHDTSGKIHVEAAAPTTFTLGQFFDIWGEPLNRDTVADITGEPIKFYVNDNGHVIDFVGDPRTIQFVSHREITIQIGTPIGQLPNYTWNGN